jgi:glycosyltransferase involved in cell wall biosynthesis
VTYSVVAPVYNESATLDAFHRRLTAVLERLGEPYEVILIDDGSRDDSLEVMRRMHAGDRRVRVLSFSRNFGHQIAISAGIDAADGDAVIVIDSDLQDPPEVIPELVAAWQRGYEVVYAVRTGRQGETRFKLATAKLFYRLLSRIAAVDIPHDTGDFRLMDRRAVLAMRRLHEHHRFMRGLSSWIGYRQTGVHYVRQERFAGSTSYPLRKMLKLATDAMTSFSYLPLQLATSFGFSIAGLSVLGIILTVILRLTNRTVAGQATTLVAVLFLGGIQLIFLGVIGEYLGRIYDEVKGRPLYLIREAIGFGDERGEPVPHPPSPTDTLGEGAQRAPGASASRGGGR